MFSNTILVLLLAVGIQTGHFNRIKQGRATTYYPGDGHCGKVRADGRPFLKTDWHIAHRSLPMHTLGVLCNKRTKICIMTYVGDRGPFGAIAMASQFPPQTPGGEPRIIRRERICYWYQDQPELQPGWTREELTGATIPCKKLPPVVVGKGYLGKIRLMYWKKKYTWWQAQTRLQPGWKYRGEFDITMPLNKITGQRPFDTLVFYYRKGVKYDPPRRNHKPSREDET